MNAACRNFISRDVQPRAANASDIVDGSYDATGRYYTRASLPQAFRRGTNAEPSLFVLCIQLAGTVLNSASRHIQKQAPDGRRFRSAQRAPDADTTKERNESLKKIALL